MRTALSILAALFAALLVYTLYAMATTFYPFLFHQAALVIGPIVMIGSAIQVYRVVKRDDRKSMKIFGVIAVSVIVTIAALVTRMVDQPSGVVEDRAARAANAIATCRNKKPLTKVRACFDQLAIDFSGCEFYAGEELLLREENEPEKARRVRALAKEDGCDNSLFSEH